MNYCSACGSGIPQPVTWPVQCGACGRGFWRNAIPVVVVIVPVRRIDGTPGVVVVERAIEPCRGGIALPGGFLEVGDWRLWAAREVFEETNIQIANPERLELVGLESNPEGDRLLAFSIAPEMDEKELPPFIPNDEVARRFIADESIELCFPLHATALRRFFGTTAKAA